MKSPYSYAKGHGFNDTLEDLSTACKGKNAYEIAVEFGYRRLDAPCENGFSLL